MSRRRSPAAEDSTGFRLLFANNPLAMWVYDLETLRFLEVNEAAVAQYGYSRAEFLGMRLSDIRPPDEMPRLLTDIAQPRPALQFSGEWRHRRKDGQLIDAEIVSHTLRFGDRPAVLVVAHDVTQRRRAEAALGESETRYRELFNNATDLIYAIDLSGRFTAVNRAALGLTGYTLDEALGSSVDRVVAPECMDEVREMVARKLTGIEDRNRYELELITKDGRRVPVEVSTRVILAGGRPVGIQGIARDITDRKNVEQALQQLNAAQAERVAVLEALFELSGKLRAAQDLSQMYPILTGQARRLLHADYGSLALLDADRAALTCVHSEGHAAEDPGSTFSLIGSLQGQVTRTGITHLSRDSSLERLSGDIRAAQFHGFGPLAILPVRSEQEVMGTLAVARRRTPDQRPFTKSEVHLLHGIAEMAGTAIRRAQLHRDLQQAYVQMVMALAQAIESRDSYTAGHSARLVALADALAREMGCPEEEIADIRWGARLHDIGKIGVPDTILKKPGPLVESEWALMRQHPVVGAEILQSLERMRNVATFVRHHQERWDGTGYPDGLSGEQIPLGARVLAVVDAYGAMTDARPYRGAITYAEAIEEIRRCAGTQFDPRVAQAFCKVALRPGPG